MLFTDRQQQRVTMATTARLLACLLLTSMAAVPEEEPKITRKIAVITHLENEIPSLTRGELTRMFKKTQTEWPDGERCIPLDQLGGGEIRAEFSRVVLHEGVDDMKRYWMQQTMTGNARPPVSLENSATVKKYVQKLRGAVAYVYEDEVDDTVRIMPISDAPELAGAPKTEADPPDDEEPDSPSKETSSETLPGREPAG